MRFSFTLKNKKQFSSILVLIAVLLSAVHSFAENIGGLTTYTLGSYNIKGTSMTSVRMAEVIKVVKYMHADCVALQEVNSWTKGAEETSYSFHNWLEQLMKGGEMNYSYFLKTDALNKTYYGIGMLTKVQPLNISTKVIKNPGGNTNRTLENDYGENRGLIIAEFEDYYYIGAHFSLVADYRRLMVDWIVDTIATFNKPVFIGGDFNMTWTTTPMPYLKAGGLKNNLTGTAFTQPSSTPTKSIDFIIGNEVSLINSLSYDFVYQGGGLVLDSGADLVLATDHLPISCRFQLGKMQSDVTTVNAREYNSKICSDDAGITVKELSQDVEVKLYDSSGRILYNNKVSGDIFIPMVKSESVFFIMIYERDKLACVKFRH